MKSCFVFRAFAIAVMLCAVYPAIAQAAMCGVPTAEVANFTQETVEIRGSFGAPWNCFEVRYRLFPGQSTGQLYALALWDPDNAYVPFASNGNRICWQINAQGHCWASPAYIDKSDITTVVLNHTYATINFNGTTFHIRHALVVGPYTVKW